MKYESKSEKETFALGRLLGNELRGGDIVLLAGDLGAGKTVFAKGIAVALGVEEPVLSPTFTLMNEYAGRSLALYHFDCYRLHSVQEAEEAGLLEFFGNPAGVCVVEWAENIAGAFFGDKKTTVRITRKDENTRTVEVVNE